MGKFIVLLCVLISVSCQKYTCQCEITNNQSTIVGSELYEMTKTSYGRAENDCARKGEKLKQKCYILMK